MNTKTITLPNGNANNHSATVARLRKAAKLTLRKNRDASPCAIMRALSAATRKLANVGRAEFIEAFTHRGSGFVVSPHTANRQFYEGRK